MRISHHNLLQIISPHVTNLTDKIHQQPIRNHRQTSPDVCESCWWIRIKQVKKNNFITSVRQDSSAKLSGRLASLFALRLSTCRHFSQPKFLGSCTSRLVPSSSVSSEPSSPNVLGRCFRSFSSAYNCFSCCSSPMFAGRRMMWFPTMLRIDNCFILVMASGNETRWFSFRYSSVIAVSWPTDAGRHVSWLPMSDSFVRRSSTSPHGNSAMSL